MAGTLYIVATPIGHLSDMSPRAAQILGAVDFVLAEDTRVVLKLLNHHGIRKRLYSYSEHSSKKKDAAILRALTAGKSCALVSDAGTPAVSDPGARLIAKAVDSNIPVVPIPGPSAVTALVSVFGRPETPFHFWGFFPVKRKKQTQLMDCIDKIPGIHVFFESPFRILKTLAKHFRCRDDLYMVVGREMTKVHETFYRGRPVAVYEALKADRVKGEFCVGVAKCNLSGVSKKVNGA